MAIQRTEYSLGVVGARNDDIVGAVAATIHVLKDEPAPAPFSIKDKREALLLLAHYIGDIHQPLHVGAVYLNVAGARIDPDAGSFDPATPTRGGNQIATVIASTNKHGASLHATWDGHPCFVDSAPDRRRVARPSPRSARNCRTHRRLAHSLGNGDPGRSTVCLQRVAVCAFSRQQLDHGTAQVLLGKNDHDQVKATHEGRRATRPGAFSDLARKRSFWARRLVGPNKMRSGHSTRSLSGAQAHRKRIHGIASKASRASN